MKAAAWMLLAIGGGLFAWAIGSRLSTDAVGMGVGLVFGMLAGIPAALLVFAATKQRVDDGAAYEAGYSAGVRDTVDMQRGIVRQLPAHRPAAIAVEQPAATLAPQYTPAYPFGAPSARPPALVGEVVLDATNSDDCPDWCEPWVWDEVYNRGKRYNRTFRITGEVES